MIHVNITLCASETEIEKKLELLMLENISKKSDARNFSWISDLNILTQYIQTFNSCQQCAVEHK